MLSAWVYATSGASAGKTHVVGVHQQGPYEGLSSPDADDDAKGAAYAAVAEAVPSAVASAMAASTAAAPWHIDTTPQIRGQEQFEVDFR